MAKGQYLTPYQKSIVNNYYEHRDTMTAQKLGELVSDLWLATGTPKADKLWETAAKALAQTPANPTEVARIIAEKNLEELARVVNQIAGGKPSPAPAAKPATRVVAPPPAPAAAAPAPAPAASAAQAPAPEVLKQAIKAFKKRLKLTRLDEESKLGRSPMSAGTKSSVIAIVPPNQYPRAVWEALVKEGRLKNAGQGFYELVEP